LLSKLLFYIVHTEKRKKTSEEQTPIMPTNLKKMKKNEQNVKK